MVVKPYGALLVEVSQRGEASGFDFLALCPVLSLVPDQMQCGLLPYTDAVTPSPPRRTLHHLKL